MAECHFPDPNSRDLVDETYHPQDAIGNGIKASSLAGAAGLFMSAIQNSTAKHNVGTFGVISRTGSSVALFGMFDD